MAGRSRAGERAEGGWAESGRAKMSLEDGYRGGGAGMDPETPGRRELAIVQGLAPDALSSSLLDELYPELYRIARTRMAGERADHTLQPTALISELYVRLLRRPDFVWKDRLHFLLYAATAMRNILVDYAKTRNASKRPKSDHRVELTEAPDAGEMGSIGDILDVDAALSALSASEPRMAQVVEMRFFGGFEFEEIGRAMGLSGRTVRRDWVLAREWLRNHLEGGSHDSARVQPD
jgi:RNA polymerase sigma factor (TIGR02999 family)